MTPDNAVIGPIAANNGAKGADMVPLPLDQAREFARHSKAENTLRGYRADWRDFCEWCEAHAVGPLPALPETVASYIAECARRLKVGSIQRRLNAIAEAHKAMGAESPTSAGIVRATLKGIRRTNYRDRCQPKGRRTDRRHPHYGGCGGRRHHWRA